MRFVKDLSFSVMESRVSAAAIMANSSRPNCSADEYTERKSNGLRPFFTANCLSSTILYMFCRNTRIFVALRAFRIDIINHRNHHNHHNIIIIIVISTISIIIRLLSVISAETLILKKRVGGGRGAFIII